MSSWLRNPERPRMPRHSRATRTWHWATAAATVVSLMSGLAIFNAHPRLYWGSYGAWHDRAWLAISGKNGVGQVWIGDRSFETTGFLGYWETRDGKPRHTAFPAAVTLPSPHSLSGARHLHLASSWVFQLGLPLYLLHALLGGHLIRDLVPRPGDLRPAQLLRDSADHLRLRHRRGAASAEYNVLQRITYLFVVAALLPTIVLSGLALSPAMTAAWPWLLDLLGGRQSARSVHFLTSVLLSLFLAVHLLMLLVSGPWPLLRDMILGGERTGSGTRR